MADRSLAVTLVAVVGMVYGSLTLLAGVLICVALPTLAALMGYQSAHEAGADPETTQAFVGMLEAVGILSLLAGAIIMMVGAAVLAAGLGVLKLRRWGRIGTLVIAGLMALLAMDSIRRGDAVAFVLTAGYAALAFGVLLPRRYAAEFSTGAEKGPP